MAATKTSIQSVVRVSGGDGITLIPASTPLTGLNYFDGKYLRAQDLTAEQGYLRARMELANQAGGAGVVHGLELSLAGGDGLHLAAGMALDPQGRVLLLPQDQTLGIADLIAVSQGQPAAAPGGRSTTGVGGFDPCPGVTKDGPTPIPAQGWYLIVIAHAEILCGEESVYGNLCAEACVTTTDRLYRVEGLVVRARPLVLKTPLPDSALALSEIHLRSRLASAYFADESARLGDQFSAAYLKSQVWCAGAEIPGGLEVPLGVLVRQGSTTRFIDQWTARRERLDAAPGRWWQWRLAMRPWDVFLAQLLQFQCQLRDALAAQPVGGGGSQDPCNQAQALVTETADHLEAVLSLYRESAARLAQAGGSPSIQLKAGKSLDLDLVKAFESRVKSVQASLTPLPRERELIHRGLVELPSAGYLPVVPGDSQTVNLQVRRLLGEGLDLRFCIVRPDFVPHALEEAQHMERISLLEGLDHPERKPEVDILVPNGRIAPGRDQTGRYYEMRVNLIPENFVPLAQSVALGTRLERTREAGRSATADASRAQALAAKSLVRDDGTLAPREGETYSFQGVGRGEANAASGVVFHYAGLTGNFELEPSKTEVLSQTRDPSRYWIAEDTKVTGVRASLWVSLELAADPTGLVRGAQTQASGEVYLLVVRPETDAQSLPTKAAAGSSRFLVRALFKGHLVVEQVSIRADGTAQVDAALSGELTLTVRAGDDTDVVSLHLAEPVLILRSPGPLGPGWRIELKSSEVLGPLVGEVQVDRVWTAAEQAEVRGTVTYVVRSKDPESGKASSRSQVRQLFRAWQQLNGAVAEPAHPAHERSIRALRAIGTALGGGSRFADLKAAELFPAPKAVADGLQVLGSLDWVLFHRRRSIVCTVDAPKAPVQTRRYGLYQLTLDAQSAIERVQKAMTANDTGLLAKLKPDFLQVVEFAAGVQSVLSPHAQVRATWRQDVDGAAGPVAGGVIASAGSALAEGKALAGERLEALADVIAPESGLAATPDWLVLERLPDWFAAAREDGVILLMTLAAKEETTCHRVYWLSPISTKDLDTLLDQGALDQLPGIDGWVPPLTHEVEPLVRPLGTLSFQGEGTAPVSGTDVTALIAAWGPLALDCPPAQVLSYRLGSSGSGGDALIGARSQAIAGLLGTQAIDPRVLPAATIPGVCPVVTLVRPAAICLQTHRLAGDLERFLSLIDRGDIPNLVAGPGITRLGDLVLCAKSGRVYGGDIEALGPNDAPAGIWYAIQPGFTALTEDQVVNLLKESFIPALGPVAGDRDLVRVNVEGTAWPSNCPLLALVLVRGG